MGAAGWEREVLPVDCSRVDIQRVHVGGVCLAQRRGFRMPHALADGAAWEGAPQREDVHVAPPACAEGGVEGARDDGDALYSQLPRRDGVNSGLDRRYRGRVMRVKG